VRVRGSRFEVSEAHVSGTKKKLVDTIHRLVDHSPLAAHLANNRRPALVRVESRWAWRIASLRKPRR
jgi:hypothetical protein